MKISESLSILAISSLMLLWGGCEAPTASPGATLQPTPEADRPIPTTLPSTEGAIIESKPIALAAVRAIESNAANYSTGPSGSEATLGQPLPVYDITLSQLRSPGASAQTLLSASNSGLTSKMVWPIRKGEDVVGGANVEKLGNKWELTSTANSAELRQLQRALDKAQRTHANVHSFAALQVKALHLVFITFHEDGKLKFLPVRDYPSLDLKSDQVVDAEEIMPKISAAANQYNALPN